MSNRNYTELAEVAAKVRMNALKAIHCANSGHPGGSLSAADILTALYFDVMNIDPKDPNKVGRDKFVLSKGHAVPALYAALGLRGYYPVEDMMTLRQIGSKFSGHPSCLKVPGIDMSTGSLGQGFAAAVGMATAGKIDKSDALVYVLTGDGELQEGIIWEAAMSASQRKLSNLIAIVDDNGLQIDGKTDDVKQVAPIDKKFESFGWNVIKADGHSFESLLNAFDEARKEKGAPTVIVAKTHKGQGVSFMADEAGWHGKAPNDEELLKALAELGGKN